MLCTIYSICWHLLRNFIGSAFQLVENLFQRSPRQVLHSVFAFSGESLPSVPRQKHVFCL